MTPIDYIAVAVFAVLYLAWPVRWAEVWSENTRGLLADFLERR